MKIIYRGDEIVCHCGDDVDILDRLPPGHAEAFIPDGTPMYAGDDRRTLSSLLASGVVLKDEPQRGEAKRLRQLLKLLVQKGVITAQEKRDILN